MSKTIQRERETLALDQDRPAMSHILSRDPVVRLCGYVGPHLDRAGRWDGPGECVVCEELWDALSWSEKADIIAYWRYT